MWFEGNKAEKSRTSSSIKALFMCLHAAWMRIILLSTSFMYGYQPTENSLPFFSSHPIHSLTSSHQLQFDSVHCSLFEKSNFSSTTTNLFNLIQVRQISTTFLAKKTLHWISFSMLFNQQNKIPHLVCIFPQVNILKWNKVDVN